MNHQGVNIFYEIEGQGRPLLLQYGQYIPHEIWRHLGYVGALKNDFQLIMVDARGQGDSDQPVDIHAYTEEVMVGDLLCVMDHLGLQQAGYMGYSSGGGLGYGLACRAPERVSALIAWHWAAVDYPSYVDCLPRMTMPCLVFAGDQEEGWERIQRRFVGMPNVKLVGIPGGMHFEDGTWVNILRPEILALFH